MTGRSTRPRGTPREIRPPYNRGLLSIGFLYKALSKPLFLRGVCWVAWYVMAHNINWIYVYQVYGLKTWMFIPPKLLQDRPTNLSNHPRWVVSTNSFDPEKAKGHLSKKGKRVKKDWLFRGCYTPEDVMEPENTPLEKENHLRNHHFQVLC